MKDIIKYENFYFLMAMIAMIIVAILIAGIVLVCTDSIEVRRQKSCRAAKKRVGEILSARLKECDPLYDKNLLKITHAMNYILEQFQYWKSLHPGNDRVIMFGIDFISCAIMLSRTIDMYQDGLKLTADQESQLIEWRILRKPAYECDKNIIISDIFKLVKDAIDCVECRMEDFCSYKKEDSNILYRIKAAFEIFKSGMEVIKEKNKEELEDMLIRLEPHSPPLCRV
ncbi:hypothetical protein [Ehrlichia muris]|uniref:Uncharacterized protein n=1 Tax=Ehrlichia muris AS145 TaxID=1423892 RepID=V9RA42_9RICK|nr:hypothetical protein [Ehrlichia muris]AHC39741.1 hypothetical protein EMUR_03785 [Ehrlichia muris AS145]